MFDFGSDFTKQNMRNETVEQLEESRKHFEHEKQRQITAEKKKYNEKLQKKERAILSRRDGEAFEMQKQQERELEKY